MDTLQVRMQILPAQDDVTYQTDQAGLVSNVETAVEFCGDVSVCSCKMQTLFF